MLTNKDKIYDLVATSRANGATYREIGSTLGLQQGQVTAALSALHKEGKITRLANVRRAKCSAYVTPSYIEGRATVSPGRAKGVSKEVARKPLILSRDEADMLERVRDAANRDRDRPMPLRRSTVKGILDIIDRALR